MIYPYGLSNLPLDKKRRYSHKKTETTTNTKVSETLPTRKILSNSPNEKCDWVMG
jgi:hypothetical protein